MNNLFNLKLTTDQKIGLIKKSFAVDEQGFLYPLFFPEPDYDFLKRLINLTLHLPNSPDLLFPIVESCCDFFQQLNIILLYSYPSLYYSPIFGDYQQQTFNTLKPFIGEKIFNLFKTSHHYEQNFTI